MEVRVTLLDGGDCKTLGPLPPYMPIPHLDEACLDVPSGPVGIEERERFAMARELCPEVCDQAGMAGKPQRKRFIFGESLGDKLGKPDRIQQARRYTSGECRSQTR